MPNVSLLSEFLSRKYKTSYASRKDSLAMRAAAQFLTFFGAVKDPSEFLENYATTVGHTIYLPFDIGDFSKFPEWTQCTTLCHEHQHIVISNRMGSFSYLWNYARSAKRSMIEAECYATLIELNWHVKNIHTDPHKLAAVLDNAYSCSSQEIAKVESFLSTVKKKVEAGGFVTEIGQLTVPMFKKWLG